MKTILIFLALVLAVPVVSQSKRELIFKYAVDHLGQKVGDGNCDELVVYAYREACGCEVREKGWFRTAYYSFGEEVPVEKIKPGDIMVIRYFNKYNGREVDGHVAVVYTTHKSFGIEVIHQNNGLTKRKDAFLMVSNYDEAIGSNPNYTAVVTYFRPE